MENNKHFCIRHPFNGIKNWWTNKGLNGIHAAIVFLCMLEAVIIGSCCWKCVQFDTPGWADTTKITISETPPSKCFSETIYIFLNNL